MSDVTNMKWVFDALPPSGARRGGNPAEHAFRHDLPTFVREVVQNANDQARGFPTVRFGLRALEGDELAQFKSALRWDTLCPHLSGASGTKGGAALAEHLAAVEESGRLMLLRVEDRGTVGLTGPESEGESHFRALCKDTLYSHKEGEAAGGSYGLGKSVLWSFSGLSTVLFNSVLVEDEPGRTSPRLIGRTELASHPATDGWYTGAGWLGRVVAVDDGGERAESLWSSDAARLAEALYLSREDESPGTSILIVGFRDPSSDALGAVPELTRSISHAVTRFFWPAMLMSTRRLQVAVGNIDDESGIDVGADATLKPFVECYRERHDPQEELERPGDVIVRRIPIDLPRRRDEDATEEVGYVDLVVRLAPERARDPLLGHVALFRGPGMVIRYWDRSALTLGMRPFHAILVCGLAREPEDPSPADIEVERFLRAAEPPGHDDWHATPALKQAYHRGYGKALQRLKDRVSEELRLLLTVRAAEGTSGPDKLKKRFPIGARGGRGSEPSPFRFDGLRARWDGLCWHVGGRVTPKTPERAWRARLSLYELGDDGLPVDPIPIESVDTESTEVDTSLEDGVAVLVAPPGVTEVSFQGASAELPMHGDAPGELGVEMVGEIVVEAP